MKNYRIADLSVNMEIGGRTYKQSRPFFVSDCPDSCADIVITGITEHIRRIMEDDLMKNSDPETLEYVISGRRFYKALVDFDGFMLHSSTVVYNNKAYLFSAPSGTGKSTHTSLWVKRFPGAYILNDDKPALRLIDGKFYVYGTPWNGKSKDSINERVELGGICFLYRDHVNVINRLSTGEALRRMIKQTAHQRFKRDVLEKLIKTWDVLLQTHPVYEMGCLPNEEAAQLSYTTMKGD